MHILESIAVRCNKIIKQRLYEKALRENTTHVSLQRDIEYVGPAVVCTNHRMLF